MLTTLFLLSLFTYAVLLQQIQWSQPQLSHQSAATEVVSVASNIKALSSQKLTQLKIIHNEVTPWKKEEKEKRILWL